MQEDSIDLQLAVSFHRNGKIEEAKNIYKNILINDKFNYKVLYLLGLIEYQNKKYQDAIKLIKQSINIVGTESAIYSSLGDVYQAIHEYDEAINCYNISLKNKPIFIDALNNLGVALSKIKKYNEAVSSYNKILKINPSNIDALFNKANALKNLRQYNDAIAIYKKIILLKPNHIGSLCNYGILLFELKKYKDALYLFDQSLLINEELVEALINKALVLDEIDEKFEACFIFNKALNINPNYNYLLGKYLHHKMKISDWSDIQEKLKELEKKIHTNEIIFPPFILNSLITSPCSIKKATNNYSIKLGLKKPIKSSFKWHKAKNKIIKIGYYSSDFYSHATSYLMAELFESHNINKFEIYIFSFGLRSSDEISLRIQKNCFKFIEVHDKSDFEIAKISRKIKIDIAIDLKGFTNDSRPDIFKFLCAPIQVNYLGYPGTLCNDYIDYIIADKILIPEEFKMHYTEKIIYLPDSYQINDSKRQISKRLFSKSELGLPNDGFVFCCFNNNYKITPLTFDGWMRILKAVPGSVLWLLEDHPLAAKNLRKEAAARGVDSTRLIFAHRMPLDEHLARHRLADLFIDTLPYNAHTTASDALWTGLPVLTLIGQSFAARVAASLLNAIGLPELITHTQEEYEAKAIELATNPDLLVEIKQKLARNRLNTPLFNTQRFTKHIETAYQEMYERYLADLPPDHIYIDASKEHSESQGIHIGSQNSQVEHNKFLSRQGSRMPIIKIDNKEYDLDTLSDECKAQLASIQFVEQELARLQAKAAALQTAKAAYLQALQKSLPVVGGSDTIKLS